jgi:hypothetical protein
MGDILDLFCCILYWSILAGPDHFKAFMAVRRCLVVYWIWGKGKARIIQDIILHFMERSQSQNNMWFVLEKMPLICSDQFIPPPHTHTHTFDLFPHREILTLHICGFCSHCALEACHWDDTTFF